jgi:hypothetical protein
MVQSAAMTLWVWLAGLALLWAPGFLLARLLRVTRTGEPAVAFAIQIGLGLSAWPLLLLWTSTARLAWSVAAMRAAGWVTFAAALIVALRELPWRLPRRGARWFAATMALLVILTAALRLAQIRDLAFPPWVDGVHHVMITRLLLDRGAIPEQMAPYIPGGELYYHFGFHAGFALLAACTGRTAPPRLPPLLLQYGQLLNTLVFFSMYAAGRHLLRSREGGLLTAALAMFVSWYPAFYLSWGRYPHLAGTLVLPPLIIILWRLAGRPGAGSPDHACYGRVSDWRQGLAAVVLAGGLVLIHVRVAFFAFAFAIVLAAVLAARRRFMALGRWALVTALTLVVVSPWLVRLAHEAAVGRVTRVSPPGAGASWLPLLRSVHNRELLALATGGVSGMAGWMEMPLAGRLASAAWLLLVAAAWLTGRASPRAKRIAPWGPVALLAGWVAVIAIVLYARPPGLDLTGLASLDSAVVTLFIPLSLGGGALLAWVITALAGRRSGWASLLAAAGIATGAGSLLTDVVNPITILADARDLRALEWIEGHLPRSALVAVDGRPWIAPAWVGVDGGYWIGAATSQRSILPPLLYAWALPPAEADRLSAVVSRWSNRRPGSDDGWAALRAAGVTHLYCGSHAVAWKRWELLRSPRCRPLYRDGGVVVFEMRR